MFHCNLEVRIALVPVAAVFLVEKWVRMRLCDPGTTARCQRTVKFSVTDMGVLEIEILPCPGCGDERWLFEYPSFGLLEKRHC